VITAPPHETFQGACGENPSPARPEISIPPRSSHAAVLHHVNSIDAMLRRPNREIADANFVIDKDCVLAVKLEGQSPRISVLSSGDARLELLQMTAIGEHRCYSDGRRLSPLWKRRDERALWSTAPVLLDW
jgi:hypothetical protein